LGFNLFGAQNFDFEMGLGKEAFGGGGRKEEWELYLTAPIAKFGEWQYGCCGSIPAIPYQGPVVKRA